ncbi:MAG: DUF2628 domain-containing protein [Alphaproteobacteria bacterium]|nr:DUF2628 domain-containing protein [Alphaproteobacteria bacterium]
MSAHKKNLAGYYTTPSKARTEYYDKAYDQLITEKAPFVWNWSAAFGGFMWFAYRRMYALSMLFLFIPALLLEILHYLFNFSNIGLGTLILCQVLSFIIPGLTGTRLYFHWIEKQIKLERIPLQQTIDLATLYIILALTFAQIAGLTSLGFILIGLTLLIEMLLQKELSKASPV